MYGYSRLVVMNNNGYRAAFVSPDPSTCCRYREPHVLCCRGHPVHTPGRYVRYAIVSRLSSRAGHVLSLA